MSRWIPNSSTMLFMMKSAVLLAVSLLILDFAFASQNDQSPPIQYKTNGMSFYLPKGSIPIQAEKCTRDLVAQVSAGKIKGCETMELPGSYRSGRYYICFSAKRGKSKSNIW